MTQEKLPMRKLRDVVRLKTQLNLPGRTIARTLSLSPSTVSKYIGRIKLSKLQWPLSAELESDDALESLLFPENVKSPKSRAEPDWSTICRELKKKSVTKMLLWHEYKENEPEGLSYSQFCNNYEAFAKRNHITMRQTHRAGEKMFVDFSGDGIVIDDGSPEGPRVAKLFVAVLGASNYTYVEPVFSEDLATWVGCHIRACAFFGGTPELWVPDNLKSAVTTPCRYEPLLNETYEELSRHYGAAIIPARVRKPRDKAKAELGVLLAERWILAVLRHRRFTSLRELCAAIRDLLEKLNQRRMQKIRRSRRELFDEIERSALLPLPSTPFVLATWAKGRVAFDYHVQFKGNYYSAPFRLAQEIVEIRATETTVELLHRGVRVASHVRSYKIHDQRTDPLHMPRGHQEYAAWTPERVTAWAKTIGPSTERVADEIMKRRSHPEQGFRACMGVIRLKDKYSMERLEAACARAVKHETYTYRSIQAILRNGLDRVGLEGEKASLPLHENLRGAKYYH